MTDTPDWVLKEAAKRCDWQPGKTLVQMRGYLSSSASFTELCRAIEQHEAFKQEVSGVMTYIKALYPTLPRNFNRFIIPAPKPDPLVEAFDAVWPGIDRTMVNAIRAALKARGLEIREKSNDR